MDVGRLVGHRDPVGLLDEHYQLQNASGVDCSLLGQCQRVRHVATSKEEVLDYESVDVGLDLTILLQLMSPLLVFEQYVPSQF